MTRNPKQDLAAGRIVKFPEGKVSRAPDLSSDVPHGDYLVHARALYGWPEHLAAENVCYDRIARQAGLDDVDATRFDGYISLSRFAHFLELAADASGDELIALRWVAQVDDSALGPFTLCLAYAPTMRAAFEVLTRYLAIHVDAASCNVTDEAGVTTFSWTYSPLIMWRDQLVDRGAGHSIGRMRAMLPGNTPPLKVELMRRRPASVALHCRLFGPHVLFECDRNSFSYGNELLDVPNPNADENLFAALCELNSRLVGERRCASDLILRVKEEILRRLAEDIVALEPIARQLGHSSRSLQRRLAGYNTTFNDLLELTRREAAKRYIEETDFLISEIAYRLGFSTIGNFTRAAKRWFGRTPREYRQSFQSTVKRG